MPEPLSTFNQKLKVALNVTAVKDPYISVNKLAEYMEASPVRRRQIIRYLKEDAKFRKTRYQAVRTALAAYFKSGYDISILERAIADIDTKKKDSDWDENDHKNSILALKALMKMELPSLDDYDIVTDVSPLEHVVLAGVKVYLKPDLFLRNKYSKKIGAIKFHFAKTEENRLSNTSRQYAATMLKYGFLCQGLTDKEVDNNMCLSVDIFESDYSSAPAAYKRSIDALTASCEEIKARWDTV